MRSKLSTQKIAEALTKALNGESEIAFLGSHIWEHYNIENIRRNDAPEHHGRLHECIALVTYEEGWFPFPHSVMLSMLSFYVQALSDAAEVHNFDTSFVEERVNSVLALTKLIDPEARRESQDKEWPLTVDSWLPEGWDK